MISSQIAYIHVRGQAKGKRINIGQYLDQGYYPTNLDNPAMTEDEVEHTINTLNSRLGVSEAVRLGVEIGTMFGWHVPGAIPALRHFGAPEIVEEVAKQVAA